MGIILIKRQRKRLLAIFSFFICAGCSSPVPRQWELYEISSTCPSFYAGKLVLKPDSDSRIEIEVSRNRFGTEVYLNLLFSKAIPCNDNPHQTEVYFTIEGQETRKIFPFILEGSQRLVLSKEDGEYLIQTLLEGNFSTIQIGRTITSLTPLSFDSLYEQLLTILIETENL